MHKVFKLSSWDKHMHVDVFNVFQLSLCDKQTERFQLSSWNKQTYSFKLSSWDKQAVDRSALLSGDVLDVMVGDCDEHRHRNFACDDKSFHLFRKHGG